MAEEEKFYTYIAAAEVKQGEDCIIYEKRYVPFNDMKLKEAGVEICVRTLVEKGTAEKKEIEFQKGKMISNIDCIHNEIQEIVPKNISIVDENFIEYLSPEDYYFSLKSFIEGSLEIGIIELICNSLTPQDEDQFKIDHFLATQMLTSLLEIAPVATLLSLSDEYLSQFSYLERKPRLDFDFFTFFNDHAENEEFLNEEVLNALWFDLELYELILHFIDLTRAPIEFLEKIFNEMKNDEWLWKVSWDLKLDPIGILLRALQNKKIEVKQRVLEILDYNSNSFYQEEEYKIWEALIRDPDPEVRKFLINTRPGGISLLIEEEKDQEVLLELSKFKNKNWKHHTNELGKAILKLIQVGNESVRNNIVSYVREHYISLDVKGEQIIMQDGKVPVELLEEIIIDADDPMIMFDYALNLIENEKIADQIIKKIQKQEAAFRK